MKTILIFLIMIIGCMFIGVNCENRNDELMKDILEKEPIFISKENLFKYANIPAEIRYYIESRNNVNDSIREAIRVDAIRIEQDKNIPVYEVLSPSEANYTIQIN